MAGRPTRLVLASASPRRRELLAQLGLSFDVRPANVDESVHAGEPARAYVERIARAKAAAFPGEAILAADTTVVVDGRILGKPRDAAEAGQMLGSLSGRAHEVLTAVALGAAVRTVETRVFFRRLSPAEIAWYVRTGEPLDKAGAYAIQGAGGAFVERVEGSVSNVVGLPLAETIELLTKAGVALPWTT